jgi:hypothetical protein
MMYSNLIKKNGSHKSALLDGGNFVQVYFQVTLDSHTNILFV